MPGYNHSASCTCGWCLKNGRGGYRGAVFAGTKSTRAFARLESFTIPNAYCPVCGATVFYYQSPTGGRVFFDELGPPWPKHPCTDNGASVRLTSTTSPALSHPKPNWEVEGWMPVTVKSSSMAGNWHLVPMEILERRSHIVVLSAEPLRVPPQACAAFGGFDREGYGLLAILDLDASESPRLIEVYQSERFSQRSAYDDRRVRRRA